MDFGFISEANIEQISTTLQAGGIKLAAAAATFILGRWLALFVVAAIKQAINRTRADATLTGFVGHVVYGLLMAVVAISALGQLGFSTTSAAALLGGAGVAVGLSLRDQLSSFAAGVMLIMFRPFRRGDFVQVGGVEGTVEELKIVATVLKTTNNQEITIPNNRVWGSPITNFTIRPQRRIDLPLGIAYDADLRLAKDVLKRIIAADKRVLADPAPWIGVTELGGSSVVLTFRPWVNTPDYWQVRSDLIEQVKLQFDAAGIGIPFPQMDVHLRPAEVEQEPRRV